MKIVIPDWKTITDGDIDVNIFKQFGEVEYYPLTPDELIAERIKDADIILCNKTPLNKDTLKLADNLKYIGLFATGYNNVDLDYVHERGITVCNAGSYAYDAVAQHTFAFILNHYNKIAKYDEFVKNSGWINSETFSPFVFPINEIAYKTIGIIGCGSIGWKVAAIANAFGMQVFAYSRSKCGNAKVESTPKDLWYAEEYGDIKIEWMSLDKIYEYSDIITVHCPLNEDSYRMFNAETFAKFKKGAYFINAARGAIMDEQALYDALESGQLSGAAIDVLEREPMDKDCILMKAKNITITPHVAWAPKETRERLIRTVVSNISDFLYGRPSNEV